MEVAGREKQNAGETAPPCPHRSGTWEENVIRCDIRKPRRVARPRRYRWRRVAPAPTSSDSRADVIRHPQPTIIVIAAAIVVVVIVVVTPGRRRVVWRDATHVSHRQRRPRGARA